MSAAFPATTSSGGFHLKPAATFEELTDNPVGRELREVYGDVEQVDLMVGLAEPLPKGFGFSDTAFRVFILMASRRLKSDRFFTGITTPRRTQTGLDWIDETTMSDVLLRHFPELEPALQGVDNAFARGGDGESWRPGCTRSAARGRPCPRLPVGDERELTLVDTLFENDGSGVLDAIKLGARRAT